MKRILFVLVLSLFACTAHADKRFYLCDIIGDGDEFNPYRAAIADSKVAHVAVIPSDPDTGAPLFSWALVRVAAKNHSALATVCDPLPDFPMDGKVSGINTATKATMKARVRDRTGASAAWIDGTDGYREVIRTLGQILEPGFSENNFDVSE